MEFPLSVFYCITLNFLKIITWNYFSCNSDFHFFGVSYWKLLCSFGGVTFPGFFMFLMALNWYLNIWGSIHFFQAFKLVFVGKDLHLNIAAGHWLCDAQSLVPGRAWCCSLCESPPTKFNSMKTADILLVAVEARLTGSLEAKTTGLLIFVFGLYEEVLAEEITLDTRPCVLAF